MIKNNFVIVILLIGSIILSIGCKENITKVEINDKIEIYVNIKSPNNNDLFSQSDKILFNAELVSNDTIIEYDSIRWTSNLVGLIGLVPEYDETIPSGKHSITCSIFKDSSEYNHQINITVLDYIKIDTLYSENNLNIFHIKDVDNYIIEVDKNDNCFLGTANFGLILKENNSWKSYNRQNGLKDNFIQAIAFDNNNIIHVGYSSINSISKKNSEGWIDIPMDEFSIYQDVHNITFDENNNLYAALHYGEIVKYVNDKWEYLPNQPMKFHHPNSLFFDGEQSLCGSSGFGCFKFKNGEWQLIEFEDVLLEAYDFVIDQNGTIWALNYGVLYKIKDNEFLSYPASFFGNGEFLPYSIEIDLNNNVLLGTKSGIIKFDGTNKEKLYFPDMADKVIYDIEVDSKNNIWFCTKTSFGIYYAN